MGLNTTIVLLNDRLDWIRRNPDQFVDSLNHRIQLRQFGEQRCGSVVVSCEHADASQLVRVGGNTGSLLGSFMVQDLTDTALLRLAAKELRRRR